MMLLAISWSLGALLALLPAACMCFFGARKLAHEREERTQELEAAAAAAERGEGAPALRRPRGGPAAAAVALQRDSRDLRAPLLHPIPEDGSDEAQVEVPVQSLEELPQCVQAFLGRAIRDGRRFKLVSLSQLGKMKMEPRGGWKDCTATQVACPLEPAFVWSASVSLAPLVSLKGCDSLVSGQGRCCWQMWGAVPSACAEGPEVDQSLLARWLAEAACFPQALMPSRFLRWEVVKGESLEAEAVLSHAGKSVRATFTFDRWGRLARMRTADCMRRLPNGTYESAEWQVGYSGHMLFGLSPQGPVMQEEIATHAGVFVPTNLEAAWVLPDGSRWVYSKLTVSKVTAQL